jgi:hypothetical protein
MIKSHRWSPKIAFMTTLGVNVGDEFIREGICSFLDEVFESWTPLYVNKVDPRSLYDPRGGESAAVADKFKDADVIIQAGAPVYWKIGSSTSYSVEWAEELWQRRIFRLGPEKPILNIAAGACQAYGDAADVFLSDAKCVEFARDVAVACRWTSVRDPLASQILGALAIPHKELPCTAFHAARRVKFRGSWNGVVAVNLIPSAGHWRLTEDIDSAAWQRTAGRFLERLRRHKQVLFVAHDTTEQDFMGSLRLPGETVFFSAAWRDYLEIYSKCEAVIANRVHGAVCAAGFGTPAVLIGNDSRLLIGRYIGIPSLYVSDTSSEEILEHIERCISASKQERERLLALRESSAAEYRKAIRIGLDEGEDSTEQGTLFSP